MCVSTEQNMQFNLAVAVHNSVKTLNVKHGWKYFNIIDM